MSIASRRRASLWAVLLVLTFLSAAQAKTLPHTFTFDARGKAPKPTSVAVAGDFNDWSTTDNPMKDDGSGVYSLTLDVEEGTHAYKFVVNGDQWINDPKADKSLETDDGNGGNNSGFVAGKSAAAAAAPQADDADSTVVHLFRFDARKITPHPKAVYVAGDFNSWSNVVNVMQDDGSGVFTAKIPLTEGVHFYKFVLNGEKWVNDPTADKALEQDDGNGGKNSAVMIGADPRKFPPALPNHINMDAVRHNPADLADLDVVDDRHVRFRVRTQAGDVQSVKVVARDGNLKITTTASLFRVSTENGFDVYANVVEAPGPDVDYYFVLADGTDEKFLEPNSFVVSMKPSFETPDWAKHAIWYQIFPERFRNGDTSNDPPNTFRWQSKWFATLPGEAPGEENFYKGAGNVWKRRFGGDVQGLKQSLPYLRSLGINAIYLNPMFEAESMHKYDTSDYRHIDEHFGVKGDIEQLQGETEDPSTWQWTASDKLFLDFVAEAHHQGFKVILDGVFNHVGRDFWAFKDVLKNGKSSKYAGWFDVRDWNPPIKYIAWDTGSKATSDGSLPIFRKSKETGLVDGPRQHILAITKRWLAPDGDASRGVDGFRLDVPGDIPHPFWIEWRKLVKSTKPDAYISGEIWTWAQPWLRGDQFDAVMDYRFAVAAQTFFVNQKKASTPSVFSNDLNKIVNAYPFQVSLVLMNLFDSHDTDRFASMFVNPDLAYDATNRIQDNGPHYNPAKPTPLDYQRMCQAVTCQMTFAGAPMIYYGDENGMWGPDDPSNRQPMVWKDLEPYDDPQVKFDDAQFAHYQRVIAIHRTLAALQTGYFHTVATDDSDGTIVYSRDLGDSHVFVALNRSASKRMLKVPVSSGVWVNYMDPASVSISAAGSDDLTARPIANLTPSAKQLSPVDGTISVTLEPYGSAVLAPRGK